MFLDFGRTKFTVNHCKSDNTSFSQVGSLQDTASDIWVYLPLYLNSKLRNIRGKEETILLTLQYISSPLFCTKFLFSLVMFCCCQPQSVQFVSADRSRGRFWLVYISVQSFYRGGRVRVKWGLIGVSKLRRRWQISQVTTTTAAKSASSKNIST